MRLFATIFLVLVTLNCFSADKSAVYLRGKKAADSGDHEQAFSIFLEAAQQRDPWSQFALGVLYLKGEGVQKDIAASTHWFQQAADQGHTYAQFNLGNAYLHGRGLEQDTNKAAYWWQQAAEQGNRMAQSNLGTLFYFDYGTPQSKRLGMAWLMAAANQEDHAAKERLAEIADAHPVKGDSAWEAEPERSEVEILTQNPDHHSIHLFTAQQEGSIKRFLKMHDLTGKAFSYRFIREGKHLYGILFGVYDSAAEAEHTLESMRDSLKRQGPWAVSFGLIQDRIHELHAKLLMQ